MGRKARRRFQRPLGQRRYRRMFVLATEGTKTEPLYFMMFNNMNTVVHVRHLKGNKQSSPRQVLKRIRNFLLDNRLKDGDEAWLVIDRDQWPEDQLIQLHEWCRTSSRYGLAVSNPKFEYWLLLHLPNFQKGHVEVDKLQPGIHAAIKRARQKDTPPCTDWPRTTGTTVYRLVEKLIYEDS